MIAIDHCGDVLPGQRCSAIFFGREDIQRERAFYERFCYGNGMQDGDVVTAMVDAHVPAEPYWLVSIKPAEDTNPDEIRYHKVDDRTGQVLSEPLK